MTQWILTSSVLILLVIAVRSLFKNKMKAKYIYALWLIVLVRLLCPVNFGELSFNLLSLAEEGKTQLEEQMEMVQNPVDSSELPDSYLPQETLPMESVASEDTSVVELPVVTGETAIAEESGFSLPEINWQKVLPYVWFVGMAVMLAVIFSVNISFSTMLGLFRKELPILAKKGRGRKDLAVYLADGIYSSCLYGVLHPSIYLNKNEMGEQEKTYCVEHEYSHYLQGDMVWTLCRAICLVLHWYNPLVELAAEQDKDGNLWYYVGYSWGDGYTALGYADSNYKSWEKKPRYMLMYSAYTRTRI